MASNDWSYRATVIGAKSDRKRGRSKLACGHAMRSPVEPITRARNTFSVRWPSVASRMGAVCHGISISTDQPCSSSATACRHWPSQSSLNWFSLVMISSAMPPVELTVKA